MWRGENDAMNLKKGENDCVKREWFGLAVFIKPYTKVINPFRHKDFEHQYNVVLWGAGAHSRSSGSFSLLWRWLCSGEGVKHLSVDGSIQFYGRIAKIEQLFQLIFFIEERQLYQVVYFVNFFLIVYLNFYLNYTVVRRGKRRVFRDYQYMVRLYSSLLIELFVVMDKSNSTQCWYNIFDDPNTLSGSICTNWMLWMGVGMIDCTTGAEVLGGRRSGYDSRVLTD